MAGIKLKAVPAVPQPEENPALADQAFIRDILMPKIMAGQLGTGAANSVPAPDPEIDILPHPGTAVSMPLGNGQEGAPSEPVVKPPPFPGRPTPAAAPGYGPGADDAALVAAQGQQADHHSNADMYRGASLISRAFGGHMDESAARAQDAQADEPVKNVLQRRVQADEDLKRQEAQRKADEARAAADPYSEHTVNSRAWFDGTEVGRRIHTAIGDEAWNKLPADQIPLLKDLIKDDTVLEKIKRAGMGGLTPELKSMDTASNIIGRWARAFQNQQSLQQKTDKANAFNTVQDNNVQVKAASAGIQAKKLGVQVGERAVPNTEIIDPAVFDRPQAAEQAKNFLSNTATLQDKLHQLQAIVSQGPLERIKGTDNDMLAKKLWAEITGEKNLTAQLGQMTSGHQHLLEQIVKNPNDWASLLNNDGYMELLSALDHGAELQRDNYLKAHNRRYKPGNSGINTFAEDAAPVDVTADGASPRLDVPTMPVPPPAAKKVGESHAAPFKVSNPRKMKMPDGRVFIEVSPGQFEQVSE